MTPRPYLSFSSMALFEMYPQKWLDHHLYGKEQWTSQNMLYGSLMTKGLEDKEATGDPILYLMMARLPKFELMDVPIEANLPDGKGAIRLLAKPDTAKADYTAFYEYKSSVRRWNQRMVNESGQITFYATVIWLKTSKIPQDIELVVVQTEYDENSALRPTGELWRYPTSRTLVDIIKMTARIRRNWAGIKALCKNELL